jgi:hypothetical protein
MSSTPSHLQKLGAAGCILLLEEKNQQTLAEMVFSQVQHSPDVILITFVNS